MATIVYDGVTAAALGGEISTPWVNPSNAGGTSDGSYATCGPLVELSNTLVVNNFGMPSSGNPIKGVRIAINGTIDIPGITSAWQLFSNTTSRYANGAVSDLNSIGSPSDNLNFDTWTKLSTLKIWYSLVGDSATVSIDNFVVTVFTENSSVHGGFRTRYIRGGFGRRR